MKTWTSRTVVTSVVALIGVLLSTAVPGTVAAADDRTVETTSAAPADQTSAFPVAEMGPRTATADVLGLGYDQQITRGDNGHVEIREPAALGGGILKEFTGAVPVTKTVTVPGGGGEGEESAGNPVDATHVYDEWGFTINMIGAVTAAPGRIIVSQITYHEVCSSWCTSPGLPHGASSRVFVYDLSGRELSKRSFPSGYAVTGLDAVSSAGRVLVSIGLSQGGTRTVDVNALGTDLGAVHPGFGRAVTVTKFVPSPDGVKVATGVSTSGQHIFYLSDPFTGAHQWSTHHQPDMAGHITAIGFDKQNPTTSDIVYGTNGGVHVVSRSTGKEVVPGQGTAMVGGVNLFTADDGRRMVGAWSLSAGGSLYSLTDSKLTLIEPGVDAGRYKSDLIPGYRSFTLALSNTATTPVTVSMASSPEPGRGCWARTIPGRAKIGDELTIPAAGTDGSTTVPFGMGKITSNPFTDSQDCLALKGSAFLTLTSPDGPRDIIRVGVTGNDVQITEQTGDGRYTATVTRTGHQPGTLLGDWTLHITDAGKDATIVSPAALEAKRLTFPSMNNPHAPETAADGIFRFSVTGLTVDVEGVTRPDILLPDMIAQASIDGEDEESWTDLGRVIPIAEPVRDGTRITIPAATFDWDNTGAQPYTQFRVTTNGVSSNTIHVTDPTTVPTPPPTVNDVSIALEDSTTGASAHVRGNSLDQTPLRVSIKDKNGIIVPPADSGYGSLYDRVYYQIKDGPVITGLADITGTTPSLHLTPVRGYFNNQGMTASTPQPAPVYLSARGTLTNNIIALVNTTGTSKKESGIVTTRSTIPPVSLVGDGTNGFAANSEEGAIPLADPNDGPVPYIDKTGRYHLQLTAHATTGTLALPLPDNTTLTRSTLTFKEGGVATVTNRNGLTDLTFGTNVVAAGNLITTKNLPTNRPK
jgi:hypothetical protein